MSKPFAMSRLAELTGALLAEGGKQAGQRRGPTVMMYSHDTIGLGHMRRNSAIAQELVARVPGASVLMLVGCPAGMIFEPQPGIDYMKLPSLTKLGRGRWQAGSLRIDAATTRALRAGILERVIETFAPDVLLVDHEPAGVWDELVEPIRALRTRGRTRVILGLRDILDRTGGRPRLAGNGTGAVISELYDDVDLWQRRVLSFRRSLWPGRPVPRPRALLRRCHHRAPHAAPVINRRAPAGAGLGRWRARCLCAS